MTSKGDISEELKLHRVKQNCHHLERIVLSINNTVNPIASTIQKEHLFNIANGKAALGETTNVLAKVWAIGFSARDCFIKDCNDDANAYQNTTKRQKIKNFASEAGSYEVLRSDQRGMTYQITGPKQKRPSNWLQALIGDQFKEAPLTFLVDCFENSNSARILGSKQLIVNNGDTCYSFISQKNRMVKSEEVACYAKHEGADTIALNK